MKVISSFLLILTLLLGSCASFNESHSSRSIANEAVAPISIEDLTTIKSSNMAAASISDMINAMNNIRYKTGLTINIIDDEKMPSDIAFKIEPVIEDKINYTIVIRKSFTADMDKGAIKELEAILTQFPAPNYANGEMFLTSHSLFELYYNVAKGDFPSMQVMAKLRLFAANRSYPEETDVARVYWKQMNAQFDSQERIYNKAKKARTLERKAVMDALDKASEDQQFRNLVAKNDRKGVVKLLRSYLPWEEMPPFEKLFWETHLKVMADPLPIEDRIFVFRGIDDDIIQVAEEKGAALTREEAIKEQKIFLMSTMLTKNQGTWNRRLRSLTSMYDKYIGTDNSNKSSEFTQSARITNMFKKHSRDPKGSPFLSYTPDFNIANEFGSKKNTAYFIDPRLLYFNMTSSFETEKEVLLPLISFPDDLAAVYDNSVHGYNDDKELFLLDQSAKKLEQIYGKDQGRKILSKIRANTNKFFSTTMGGKVVLHNKQFHPDTKFVGMFQDLLEKDSIEASKVINGKDNLGCADIIQLFWK